MDRKKSKSYWKNRQKQWMDNQTKMDDRTLKQLEKHYKRISKELEKEIAHYFKEYGKDDVIEFREMLEDLSDEDRQLLFEKMDDFSVKYPQYAHLMPVRESIYKLNRLEGLHYTTQLQLLELGAIEQVELENHLIETYGKRYKQMMHELGLGDTFVAINQSIVRDTIFSKWVNDENFSDRIWANKEKLLNQLQTRYRDALARGDNYEQLIKEIIERFDVAYYDARRLVWTEANFVYNQAHTHAYRNAGVEEYEISAILDNRTSKICEELDGERFRFDELRVGINFPPFHPFCRTTFIGVLDGDETTPMNFESPDEVREWIGEDDFNWIRELTDDERDAVKEYTSIGYSGVNRYLRGQDEATPEDLKLIQELDKSIEKFTLKDDIVVYRNVSRNALPPYGYDIMDLIGKEYNDKGFMSTSLITEGAFSRHDIMLKILVPKGKGRGAYINELSFFKDEEYEFLIKRDAKFKINEVESGRMTVLSLEMIVDE